MTSFEKFSQIGATKMIELLEESDGQFDALAAHFIKISADLISELKEEIELLKKWK